MTSFDCEPDSADMDIRDGLRRLPIPATPINVAMGVRIRLRRKRILKLIIALVPMAVLVGGLLLWRPWNASEPSLALPVIARGTAKPLEVDELQVLFSAPPVDSFSILARRDQVSMAALRRLEAKE